MMKNLIFLLIAFPIFVQAQNASIQDCLGAIPVCDQIYKEELSPTGFGNVNDINGAINCNPIEENSIWYVFTVNKTGKFGFLLTPNDLEDDYDWALFNITNASCEDIRNDISLLVSCNSAGSDGCHGATGANGDSPYSMQGSNCDNFPPSLFAGFTPFNDLVDVEEGNTYVLFINNFTGSTNGYTLDFGLSQDIGIFDDTDPVLENAALSDACDGQEITLQFSEYIQCSTLSAANFQLAGAGGPFTLSLSSVNCDAGGTYDKLFFLNVNPPLQDGNYTLSLAVNGVTEALDLCGNPSAPLNFTLAGPSQIPSLNLGNDTTLCQGSGLVLNAGQLSGTYLWNDGSTGATLQVTTAGNYSVEVNTGCGIATDAIQVDFVPGMVLELGPDTTLCPTETVTLNATSAGGTYSWNDGSTNPTLVVSQPGTYSVTVTGDCGVMEDAVSVSITQPIAATLNDAALCPGDSITWDVSTPGATYLWQDGSTDPTFTATTPGTYTVAITNGCETLNLNANVGMGGALTAVDLGNDTTLCAGESLTFNFNIPDVNFQWQDGSTASSYTVNQSGTYALTISNDCGNAGDEIMVRVLAPIVIPIGLDTVLCPGESFLVNGANPNADYYRWQDNSTDPSYLINQAGLYTLIAGNDCEEVSAQITVAGCTACNVFIPNSFSPNNDGINDRFKAFSSCSFQQFNLMVFDRWGTLLYETSDPEAGWDGMSKGQPLQTGVFLWQMKYTVEENDHLKEYKNAGEVSILK